MSRLIDADAMIDKYGEWYTEEGTEVGYIGTIKGIVDSIPTIELETEEEAYERGYTAGQMAQRKKGKWKHDSDGLVWCDTCGFGKERSDDRLYRYCPNCGYRMMEGCENNV